MNRAVLLSNCRLQNGPKFPPSANPTLEKPDGVRTGADFSGGRADEEPDEVGRQRTESHLTTESRARHLKAGGARQHHMPGG